MTDHPLIEILSVQQGPNSQPQKFSCFTLPLPHAYTFAIRDGDGAVGVLSIFTEANNKIHPMRLSSCLDIRGFVSQITVYFHPIVPNILS